MPATITIKDLSPKFLAFYELAREADPETRWQLWQEHYNVAAVPPTEYGKAMARKMLDECWDRYPEVMDAIKAGAAGLRPEPRPMLEAVAKVLEFDGDMEVQVTTFVGNLKPDAWAATVNGKAYVNFPVEYTDADWGRISIPHEFAHALHAPLCEDPGGWMRSIAMTMMQEGVAIWTSRAVTPDLPEGYHISFTDPTWVERCRQQDRAILAGIRPHIGESSEEALKRFIFGPGPGGLGREVYWAGYRVVGHLLEQGYTVAQLARLKEEAFTPLIDRALAELTA